MVIQRHTVHRQNNLARTSELAVVWKQKYMFVKAKRTAATVPASSPRAAFQSGLKTADALVSTASMCFPMPPCGQANC